MQKNVASQKIGAQMVSATDGSAFTGSVTVYVTGDAGTQAAGSVGSGACTHEGNGYHTYAPAQAETNYDLIAFTFVGTGAIPQTIQVETRVDTNITHYGGTAGTFSGGRPEVNTTHWKGTTAAAVDTAGYPVVTVKSGAGSGEVDLSAGRVKVSQIANNAITASTIATDAIGAAQLAADAREAIATALLDLAAGVETNRTLRQALRLILAASAGKVSGAATTTVAIWDTNDSKDRITATVDADGNRSAVTLDAT